MLIALWADAFCKLRSIKMRAFCRHFGPSKIVVAVVAHALGIVLSISVRTLVNFVVSRFVLSAVAPFQNLSSRFTFSLFWLYFRSLFLAINFIFHLLKLLAERQNFIFLFLKLIKAHLLVQHVHHGRAKNVWFHFVFIFSENCHFHLIYKLLF